MRTPFSAIAIAIVATQLGAMHAAAGSLEDAEQAIFRFELQPAESLWRSITNDSTASTADRVEAYRRLAAVKWRVYADTLAARELLQNANALGVERGQTQLTWSRIEHERGQHTAAQAAADRAAEWADSEAMRHDADVAYGRAVAAEALAAIRSHNLEDDVQARVARALERARGVLKASPGRPDAARAVMTLAVLAGDGPAALDAWRDYFHLTPEQPPTDVLRQPAHDLAALLASWRGEPLAADARERLIRALVASRLFTEAVAVRVLWGRDSPTADTPNVIAYNDFLLDVGARTESYYRAHAVGRGDANELRRDIEAEARELWTTLQGKSDRPRFSFDAFRKDISARYGAEVRFQRANGHFGLHYGHRVIDEQRVIEQYGKRATLRYVALDFMVSNGYSSWFWDGRAQVGGWADDDQFVQVREAYVDGGVKAWRRITDPDRLQESDETIERYAALDDSLAREDPYAYLPGLAERVARREYERVRDELDAKGLRGAELRAAFIGEIDRLVLESSIFAHEGRHAIDRRDFFNFSRSASEREFRAKLSEVAFSEAPFLALCGGILAANIGDGTSHGTANERFMQGVVRWMEKHVDEIQGLERSRPLLPQLDRLNPQQLRRAVQSLDPMAPDP